MNNNVRPATFTFPSSTCDIPKIGWRAALETPVHLNPAMGEPGHDFLAGLLDFATLPDSSSNSPVPIPPTDNALRCGFCLNVKYKHQSSLDSHIKDCAQSHDYTARHWRSAGWTRTGLENGFIFENGFPVVNPNRVCPYCQKTFANAKEVGKHVSAARCINAQAIHGASPAIKIGQWKCGFCSKQRCYTSEVALDSHIKFCAPKNEYVANFWKEAGWEPNSRLGKGLDFNDGVATAKSERICQACYQCCKSLVGLTRHLENGQCAKEPDEIGLKPPPPPSPKTIAHLAGHGIVMTRYRAVGPTQSHTVEYKRLEASLRASTRPRGGSPPQTSSSAANGPKGNDTPRVPSTSASQKDTNRLLSFDKSRKSGPGTVSRHGRPEDTSSEIDFLSKVINTAPSPAITELLVKLARAGSECRAVPSAPVRSRMKRPRDPDSSVGIASRTKLPRDEG